MATEATVEPARYEFSPREDDGVAFGLDIVQLGIIVATLLVVITASRGGVPLWLVVPLAAPVVVFAAVRYRGERMTTLAARWTGWVLRPRSVTQGPPLATASVPAAAGGTGGQVSAAAPVPETAQVPPRASSAAGDGAGDANGFGGASGAGSGRHLAGRRRKRGSVSPGEVASPAWAARLRLIRAPYGGSQVGVWHDGDAYACVLAVAAPATALRDLDEQDSLLAGWGDLLASAGVEGSPVQRIAWVARTSPDQGAGAAAWLREQGDQTVRLNQPSIWRSYVEVGETAGAAGAVRELLVVLRVQPDRARHRLRGVKDKDEREQRCAQLAIEEAERVGGRLVELGCGIEGLYTPEAVAAVVRTTFDPTAHEDLGWWTAAQNEHGSPVAGMWPLTYEEAADHVRTDAGFHRVGWVEEWPTVPVLATWMHPLLLRSGWTRTVTMVMEPVETHSAVRATHRARAAATSEAEVRARHGFIASMRNQRGLAAAEQREQELIDGHRDLRFSGHVCVTGRTLTELEEAWAHTVYEAAQAKLRLRALHGQHWPALQAVLPLGRFV